MSRGHKFEPGVVVIRGEVKVSRCRTCGKAGIERQRAGSTFWAHGERASVEPPPREACEWLGTGRIWCCRDAGHAGSHHSHRGPRRVVHGG